MITKEEARKKIHSVFSNYLPFDGDKEADEVIKALEKDTVSKESYDYEYFLRKELEMEIEKLKKRSKWIFSKTIFDKHGCTAECSSCHKKWKTYDEIRWRKENKFCPNCGSRNDK